MVSTEGEEGECGLEANAMASSIQVRNRAGLVRFNPDLAWDTAKSMARLMSVLSR